jgi:UDP-N-acetylmuramate dehydrogenase
MPEILQNHSLKELNSFHLDVRAKKYSECKSVKEIQEILSDKRIRDDKILILGEGSNVLFTGDFGGIVLRPLILGREIISEDRTSVWIRTGAGENWDEFVAWCVAWGFGGIENLSLIPGSVGSSPIQNIGAYGAEVQQVIEEVDAVDMMTGKMLGFTNEACRFGYRDSIFKQEWKDKCIISTVTFRLSKKPSLNLSYQMVAEKISSREKQDLEAMREVIIEIRRSKLPDPEELGNAGSFFKNPVVQGGLHRDILNNYPGVPSWPGPGDSRKISAAWLIEQCGWKGKRRGNAGCYDKQALVLVNHGSAKPGDILELASLIAGDVYSKFGIMLEKEVNVV